MATTYYYEAYDEAGVRHTDEVRFESDRDLATHFIERHLTPVKTEKREHLALRRRTRFRAQKITLYDELATYQELGLPRHEAQADLLHTFAHDKKFLAILSKFLPEYVNEKTWRAMQHLPRVFGQDEINLLAVAADIGHETTMLRALGQALTREEELTGTLWQAVAYPLVLIAMLIVTLVVFATTLLPQLLSLYTDLQVALVWPLNWVVAMASAFKDGRAVGFMLAIVTGIGVLGVSQMATERGRYELDVQLMRLPFLGEIFRLARVIHVLFIIDLMIEAGQQSRALGSAAQTIASPVFRRSLEHAQHLTDEGETTRWGATFETMADILDPVTIGLMRNTDRTGKPQERIQQASVRAQKRLHDKLAMLPKKLSTVISLVLSVFVGFVLYLMVVPTSYVISQLH